MFSDEAAAEPISHRRWLIGLAFLGGLLLGWLVIGWGIWPVRWTNAEPWDLRPKHQGEFVELVAARYWQNRDVQQAQEALAGWESETLMGLVATLEHESRSSQTRQQAAALRMALALPDAKEPSLLASLVTQKAVLWSAALAACVLTVAIGLSVGPRVAGALARTDHQEQAGGGPEVSTDGNGPGVGTEVEALQILERGLEGGEEYGPENDQEDGPESLQEAPESQDQESQDQEAAGAQPGPQSETVVVEEPLPESVVEIFARTEDKGTEDGFDLEQAQGFLSDLFDGEHVADPRREALYRTVRDVAIPDLLKECNEVTECFRALCLNRDH